MSHLILIKIFLLLNRLTSACQQIYMDVTIPLADALTGVDFTVLGIDNEPVRVTSAEGDVISPGQKKVIQGKGMPMWNRTCADGHLLCKSMPFYERPYEFGNLVLVFAIDFPKTFSQPQLSTLKQVLNKHEPGYDSEQPTLMKKYSSSQANTDERGGKQHFVKKEDEPPSDDEPKCACGKDHSAGDFFHSFMGGK